MNKGIFVDTWVRQRRSSNHVKGRNTAGQSEQTGKAVRRGKRIPDIRLSKDRAFNIIFVRSAEMKF